MPQYRIEISKNNRAGCKDGVCKKEGVKITKGEIRFGTWVEIEERGSWAWKHWGCVSGQQIERMRELCDPNGSGEYDYDGIDGFDEIEDDDVKEKVQRCVEQGHIDAEDFKGDPEKNVLGAVGIRLSAKELKAKAKEAEASQDAETDIKTDTKAKKPNKRARKSAGDADEDEEEPQPKKKTRKVKAKDEDEDENDVKPAAKKKTAAKAKAAPKATPKKTSKKAAAKEEADEDAEVEVKKPKAAGRPRRAKA